jgi:chromosome partitioning protein
VDFYALAICGQKGGIGKSTLTTNLAVAAQAAGETVAVLDTDPQQTATKWGRDRGRPPSVSYIALAGPSVIANAVARVRSGPFTRCFIDTQPRAAASLHNVIAVCDAAVLPIRPSGADLDTAEATVKIVRSAGKPFCFVLYACPVNAPEIGEAREYLSSLGPVCQTIIDDRRAFGRALTLGLAVVEFDSRYQKIASLYAEIAGFEIERQAQAKSA